MKRVWILCAVLLLCLTLACAAKPETVEQKPENVTAPHELELKLTLPLGRRNEAAKTLPAYTAGFAAKDGTALTFTAASGDPSIAEGVLKDGTLYVIARGAGETKLTVTARTEAGEEAAATVSVKVRDARRMLVLIVLGALSVALLILIGKPAAKKPEQAEAAEPAENEEPEEPTVIFEEPNDNPERS